LACVACGRRYPAPDGRPDLRPQEPIPVTIDVTLPVTSDRRGEDRVGPMPVKVGASARPAADALSFGLRHGSRMDAALLSQLPEPGEDALLVEVGCGERAVYRPVLTALGYTYLGLDVEGPGADVLGDAHRLPLADGSVDAIVAISLLEHLRIPALAMREIRRVMRPGGVLIGTVALSEPFHMRSYMHHSHLGTIQALRDAGLEVVVVAPATDWPSIRAVTEMALFPGLFRIGAVLATPIVWAFDTASRAWWRMMRRLGRLDRSLVRPLRMTAGFRFVARRPTTEER
jgi:SAM-dependent methyltransferase